MAAKSVMDSVLYEQMQSEEGHGWKCALFINKDKIDEYKCKSCNNICKDCATLGCDHEDNEIELYCNDCLETAVAVNDKTCPINPKHVNPQIQSSVAVRKQILKLQVMCPTSLNSGKINNNMDEKQSGLMNGHSDSCNWTGHLSELMNDHIKNCTLSKDFLITNIEQYLNTYDNIDLKRKVNKLSKQVQKNKNNLKTKDTQINNLSVKITYQIAQQINDLNKKLQKKDDSISDLKNEITDLKTDLNKKDKQLNQLTNLIKGIYNTLIPKDKQMKYNSQESFNETDEKIDLLKVSYARNNIGLIHDGWNKETLSDGLTINGNKVSRGWVGGSYPCAFGTIQVKSGINIWRFNIENGGYYWYVGIINAEKAGKKINGFPNKISDSYTCSGDGFSYNQKKGKPDNGLVFVSGDILCMCLNMNEKKLSFSLNGQPFKTMFHNINTSIQYKMGICTGSSNDDSIILESCMHVD